MPNIMDYDSAAAWQAAWADWNEAQRAEREARIRAARSNAAKRGAATRERHERAAELARAAIREAEAGGDIWRARSYAHTAEILAGDLDTEPLVDIPLAEAWQAIRHAK